MSLIGQGLSVGLKPDKSGLKQTDKLKKCAYTIAEVLITIGIVGVVAAMTIPLLIQSSNHKKFTTQFKKSLSTLNQAAISAQAQYDMDYGTLSSESDPNTCASDKFSSSQSTMCALLNSTLAGKSYLGVYGEVKGSLFSTYSFTKTTEDFDPSNFLIYSMADGSLVGFNPKMKGCSLSTQLTKSILTDENGLKNCIGFIDVNGVGLPNKEVTCNDGTSALEPNNPCTLKSSARGMGDIFPVVFHNGTVEPATNAAKAFFSGEKSDTTDENDEIIIGYTDTGEAITRPRKILASNGKIYEYDSEKGFYYTKDENGNIDISTLMTTKSNTIYQYDKNDNLYYEQEYNGSINKNFDIIYDDVLYYGTIGQHSDKYSYTMKTSSNYNNDDYYGPSVLVFDYNTPYKLNQSSNNKNYYISEINPETSCYMTVTCYQSFGRVVFQKHCN